MYTFFLSIFFLGCASAQYTCECGLFLPDQFNGPASVNALPLDANATQGADMSSCTSDTATNPCAQYCDGVLASIQADNELNYCAQPNTVNMCRGGTYCNKLHSDDIYTVDSGYLFMYYRVPGCSGQGGVHEGDWTQTADGSVDEPLCCVVDFPYFADCFGGETCECVAEQGTYCECGMFVPEQFQPPQVKPGQTPRPLKLISGSLPANMTEDFCLNFGIAGEDPCYDNCLTEAQTYFSTLDLNSYPPSDPSRTYGELYCQSFKSRWPSFNAFCTTLDAHAAAPQCAVLGWLQVTGATHTEQLCCNADGSHNPASGLF